MRATGLAVWVYVIGVAWGGGALSLLRSFAEHRKSDAGTSSAVVHAGWFFSLLFLNNNLHHTHHARPGVPWYGLPDVHARIGSDRIAAAGAGLYRGYGAISRRYLFRPFDELVARPRARRTGRRPPRQADRSLHARLTAPWAKSRPFDAARLATAVPAIAADKRTRLEREPDRITALTVLPTSAAATIPATIAASCHAHGGVRLTAF